MKTPSMTMTALISCVVISCTGQSSPQEFTSTVIEKEMLDSATVVVVDSTDHRFDSLSDIIEAQVYQDSLIIAKNKFKEYGSPLISIYEGATPLHHLVDYIPRGSDVGEMVANRMLIIGDKLFIHDDYFTHRYVTIPLQKPLPPTESLQLLNSGIEEKGVAVVPFKDGLLVENPQCYNNEMADIHNEVPRLLFYKHGECQTPQEPTAYKVADINTGADLHYNENLKRICFISHHSSFIEFYDDSLRLIHRVVISSKKSKNPDKPEFLILAPKITMHQKRKHGDMSTSISATFDKTQQVVGTGSQFHAFVSSYANDKFIYLAYCGKKFSFDFHTYPTFILVMDWNGNLVDTYRFNRWVESISSGSERGTFYLTIYADDDANIAKIRLVKVVPKPTN